MLWELDDDIWGQGYKLAVKGMRLTKRPVLTDEQQMAEANKLFPELPRPAWRRKTVEEPVSLFEPEELDRAVQRLKIRKAPGLDLIPPEVARVAVQTQKEVFLKIVNRMLTRAEFPTEWKKARLVLTEKLKKKKREQ